MEILNVSDTDWVILMGAAEVLRIDAEEREEARRKEAGDIGVA